MGRGVLEPHPFDLRMIEQILTNGLELGAGRVRGGALATQPAVADREPFAI